MTGKLEEKIFVRMFEAQSSRTCASRSSRPIRYPTFVVAVMAVALVIINLFVIPAFTKVYKGPFAKLPAMTEV